jgi:hypothetical protein
LGATSCQQARVCLRELPLATGVPIKAIRTLEPTGAERKLPLFRYWLA